MQLDIWKSFQSEIPVLSGNHPTFFKGVISHSKCGHAIVHTSLLIPLPHFLAFLAPVYVWLAFLLQNQFFKCWDCVFYFFKSLGSIKLKQELGSHLSIWILWIISRETLRSSFNISVKALLYKQQKLNMTNLSWKRKWHNDIL